MRYFLNGYYGFDNAGDEAVLCSVMEAICAHDDAAHFVVTSGAPSSTRSRYGREFSIETVARQNPKTLIPAMRACDVFVSGGGSLVQDVTSLRNVFYYCGLMRLARLMRKPLVIYAQGVGPLNRKIAQRVARRAFNSAQVLTVRDEASSQLLARIGVRKTAEVTADPVWGLRPAPLLPIEKSQPIWNVALRSWPGTERADEYSKSTFAAINRAAQSANAHLRFVPMQPAEDAPLAAQFRIKENDDELVILDRAHPREVMAQCARGANVMIAMRLHALIFAAAQGVPCVAINYDPKVEALAKLIGAPLLSIDDLRADCENPNSHRVLDAVQSARALSSERLQEFRNRALKTVQLTVKSARR